VMVVGQEARKCMREYDKSCEEYYEREREVNKIAFKVREEARLGMQVGLPMKTWSQPWGSSDNFLPNPPHPLIIA